LPKRLARIFLALGVGQLLPLPGLIVLLAGEAILMLRLYLRDRAAPSARIVAGSWGPAFRAASSKWGLAVSMVLFAGTLQDKIAEIGATVALLVWLMLNLPRRAML
jgi:hypothetical protein